MTFRSKAACALVLVVQSFSVAAIIGYDEMWVIGDSYSDIGNSLATSSNVNPVLGFPSAAFGYFDGRWSDGPNWVDHIGDHLGIPLVPGFNTNPPPNNIGNNLAVGGAKTNTGNSLTGPIFGDWSGTGLRSQADAFLNAYNLVRTTEMNNASLFVVYGGANNFVDTATQAPSTVISNAVSDIDGIVRDLYGVGVRHFLIPNQHGITVPDDSNPDPFPAFFNGFAQAFNPELATMVQALRNDANLPDLVVTDVDFFGVFQDLLADTTDAITNTGAPCLPFSAAGLPAGAPCSNPETYLMYDARHPSAAAHAALGDAAIEALHPVPLPAALPLMACALASFGVWRRR